MILDKLTEFFDALAPAAGSPAGDVIDTGDVTKDLGNGETIYWYIQASADLDGTGTNVSLETSASDDLSTPNTHSTQAVVAGGIVMVALPLSGADYLQYMGVNVISTDATTGTISSGLTLDPHGWRAYPGNPGTVA